ncbi:MAG: ATP-binding protein [Bacteroidota bacterium]
MALYRILQELLANSLKHAEAKNIQWSCISEAVGLKMTYQDDGRGFERSHIEHSKGLGLKNIESRANAIHAQIHMQTQKNAGFSFDLLLPQKVLAN